MRSRSRHKVAAAFGVAGVGLMLSSTAFACTVYKGKVTFTANGAGSASQTVFGTGSGMNWCVLPTPTVKAKSGSQTVTLATAASTRGEGGSGCKASKMTSTGAYSVAVTTPGAGYMPQGGGTGATHNCHGTTGQVIVNGTGSVSSTGVFSPATVSYAQSGTGPQSICIYNTGGFADAIAINLDAVV
jgi:hypothetical protein